MKAKMKTGMVKGGMAKGGKAALLAMALAFPMLMVQPALAQQVAGASMATAPMIQVTGEGRVASAPDMAVISLGVTTEGDNAAEALAANSAAIARVIDNLRAAGMADRDIQTSGLSINPNWQSDMSKGGSTISGYIASNMIAVRVRALDTLGATLDAAVKDGANTLNGVEFALQDPAPALAEARKRAVADALAKAQLMAEAAGAKLGAIQSIVEGGGEMPPMPMMRMAAEASAGAVPVAAGETATQARVTIVWQLDS
ncbi:SIMPL domain-containing protein [Gemmobacter serpentinus]|uniref:SIMPL domain-containing protein n=1 Tax=Gemmobacter serpentinus TaxID=2652247 RepID=UPI001CF66D96|nr:SIMPL domain-containing protein [Gemmobacter serpentinus]